ncbi:MAG: ABC transporter ATP-binding protein/permease [Chlorobium sp.]|jgi:ATP-binding cassette, subfamily B, bacterial PglK|nr:ABC transporter ATP-binding protein/permease [Chlorobium sp.]
MTPSPLSFFKKAQLFLKPKERVNVAILLFLMLIGVCLETLGIGLVIPTLAIFSEHTIADKYPAIRPLLQFLGNPDPNTLLIGGVLLLFIVYLFKAVYLGLLAWAQNRFISNVEARLSLHLFTIYLRQPYAFHLQQNSAILIRNVTTEVGVFTNNVLTPTLQLITESLVIVALCVMLVLIEPVGSIIIISIFGLTSLGFMQLTKKRMTRWGEIRQQHDGMRLLHLQQGLGGAKDVKLLGRDSEFLNTYKVHTNARASVMQLNATVQQLPRLLMELLTIAAFALLVITTLAQGGVIGDIIPKMGLFAVAAFRLIPSINRILAASQALKYCSPVIDILSKELELPMPETNKPETSSKSFNNQLVLQNISYTYPAAPSPALNNISLSIKQGTSVGFIGKSGSGKSTLVDILLGLLTPDSGSIEAECLDIQENIRGWQNQIGYVSQSIYLTDDTLRKNIGFGLPTEEIDEEAIKMAISAAFLTEFVEQLPEGLDTIVGERGVRLSGGQRQRIGIARALYHNPSILVLDEATSALDIATEKEVMEAVNALQGSKTIIIVAHRLSTIEKCDTVYNLANGKIESHGTPSLFIKQ